MAYPFLPVNPSCGTVVVNDVCGCNSVVTNSGCNNNNPCSTNLTASSTIVYNGPVLSCIIAEPCDTLNVILEKIDSIICNLLTQINILTIQVNNITTQIITINGDIINIYNQLGECCTTTTSTSSTSSSTTTTSTTLHPCENFSLTNTGSTPVAIIITNCNTDEQEPIILMPGDTNICVITDSPLTVPGTIIVTPNGPCTPPTSSTTTTTSSSTSTSTSSTTTTTTTAIPCECLTFENTDINPHFIGFTDCNGVSLETEIFANETSQFCGCCGYADSPLVFITIGADCVDGFCVGISTTTTTTTTSSIDCTFDGSAEEITTTTTTTTLCVRPGGLVTVSYFNTYTYNDVIVDYTGSLIEACNACNFIKNNILDIQQETSLFGQSGSFTIGQYVYAGLFTDCLPLANGFYITDHEFCEIAEIVDGYIVDITNCEIIPITTTTTTTVALECSFIGSAQEVTTTTTTTITPTTTTTTTIEPTTTSTTTSTPSPQCYSVEIYPPVFNPGTFHTVGYLDCLGNPQTINVPDGGSMVPICSRQITSDNNNGATNTTGICTL